MRAAAQRPPRLRFVLPPTWEGFGLHDPQACERKVERIARSLPLDDGKGAALRRQVREDLRGQVASARQAGATYLAISGPRSAPLSGSIVLTPVPSSLALDDEAWEDQLPDDAETFRLSAGRVTRVVGTRTADVSGLATLVVDYWVLGPDRRQVHLACSTPLVAHRDAMVALFDAVVDSAEWHGASEEQQ